MGVIPAKAGIPAGIGIRGGSKVNPGLDLAMKSA